MAGGMALVRRASGLGAPALVRSASEVSIGDPALAEYLNVGVRSTAGARVTESSALGLTAFYRAVTLISGTLAALPWKTYETGPDDTRRRVDSWIDNAGATSGLSPFAWRELVLMHLTIWGNWYGEHVYAGGGQIVDMRPLHPSRVSVKVDPRTGAKSFLVRYQDGNEREFTPLDITHITGPSTDGVRGISPLTVARNAIGAGLAADESAARMYENGAMISGLITTEEELADADDEAGVNSEADRIAESINAKAGGAANAGRFVFINRALKLTPWTMTAEDAQFIESRAFQVEEIARFYGLPKVLLAEDGASTWGSGIAELVRGLEKFTFRGYAARIESPLSFSLAPRQQLELDFAGLLAASALDETANMLAELDAGALTLDEYRRIKNRPPLEDAAAQPASTTTPEVPA